MTRSEFNAICFACGLLLFGYAADSVAHWRSRQPSERYAQSDSIFFALAEAGTTAAIGEGPFDQDTTTLPDQAVDSGSDSRPRNNARLDLNTATHAQLVTLPGIGPALANRIIESRRRLGPFASVTDLQRVTGIGPAKSGRIAALVVAIDSTSVSASQR